MDKDLLYIEKAKLIESIVDIDDFDDYELLCSASMYSLSSSNYNQQMLRRRGSLVSYHMCLHAERTKNPTPVQAWERCN
jgi:hypothetical protein